MFLSFFFFFWSTEWLKKTGTHDLKKTVSCLFWRSLKLWQPWVCNVCGKTHQAGEWLSLSAEVHLHFATALNTLWCLVSGPFQKCQLLAWRVTKCGFLPHSTCCKASTLGHLMQRANSLEKTMLAKIEDRRRGQQRMRQHHWLNGHEFQQTLGDNGGQGSLACCSPWGRRESDLTERLNDSKAQAVGSLGGGALRTRVRPLRILFLFPAHVGGWVQNRMTR